VGPPVTVRISASVRGTFAVPVPPDILIGDYNVNQSVGSGILSLAPPGSDFAYVRARHAEIVSVIESGAVFLAPSSLEEFGGQVVVSRSDQNGTTFELSAPIPLNDGDSFTLNATLQTYAYSAGGTTSSNIAIGNGYGMSVNLEVPQGFSGTFFSGGVPFTPPWITVPESSLAMTLAPALGLLCALGRVRIS
jgi:hypothetical protein